MIQIKIDNNLIKVKPGTTILQACEQLGIEIPIFCYHEKLSIAGNCRMCLVEVKNNPKPVASCSMPVIDGMEIKTTSEMVKKARKGVMEFLLINHPLDCPICDQGGECDLQDIAMGYGRDKSRFNYNKRAVKEKNFGPLIKTVMTRCIHCTRCIRFATEIAGIPELGTTGMGENMEVASYLDKTITSELSGNMIDICPVGALTSKPFSLTARPWELNKTETIDVLDAVGSNIRVDTKDNEVMRILPINNEDINEEWISDKTRFAYDGLKYNRLDVPFIKKNSIYEKISWNSVLNLIKKKISSTSGDRISAIIGNQVDCESIILLKDLFTFLGSKNILCSQNNSKYKSLPRLAYCFNTTISLIEQSDFCLLIGTNPRIEASMVNTRIRKRYLEGNYEIFLIGPKVDLNYKYKYLGNNPQVLEEIYKEKHYISKKIRKSKKPLIIVGDNIFNRQDSMAILEIISRLCVKFPFIQTKKEDITWNGYNVLHHAASRVGALDLNFISSKPDFNLDKIYSLSEKKKLDIIYLLGADEIDTTKLKNSFIIYQGHHGGYGSKNADIILPGSAFTEKNSTFVNLEGRPQNTFKCCNPPGDAKEDWKIINAIAKKFNTKFNYFTIDDVRNRLQTENSNVFSSVNKIIKNKFKKFGKKGNILNTPFDIPVTNFYLNDVISKSSKIMRKCADKINNGDRKYNEYTNTF